MAQVSYCNTSTDLSRAYARVHEGFRDQKILSGWQAYSSTVYMVTDCGYIENLTEDGVAMTAAANLAAVNAVLEYYYDSAADILYIYPTGGVPKNHTYRAGEVWATVLTDAVQKASRDAESMLDAVFPVPIPMSPDGTAARPYDRDFIDAVARMACGHIAARKEPMRYDAQGLPEPDSISAVLYESGKKVIQEYIDRKRVFSWELTEDEIGGVNVRPYSANTSGGILQVKGKFTYDDEEDQTNDFFYRIKIALGGAVGTATYAVSDDDGVTYDTAVATAKTWTYMEYGLWVRFLPFATDSVFVINDYWQLEIQSIRHEVQRPGIRSVRIRTI